MFAELLKKEFIEKRSDTSSNRWFLYGKLLLQLLGIALFITLQCYIFIALDKKITEYSPYGTLDFLILYSFVSVIIVIIALTLRARKKLFNLENNRIMMTLPISKEKIILSRAVYLFIYSVIYLSVLLVPAMVCYGEFRPLYSYYFVFSFLLPILLSFFTVGVSLLIAPLFELVYRLIKGSDLIQFILASLSVIGLCFAYKFLLDVFLTALSDSSIGGLFDLGFVEGLHKAIDYFIPVVHMIKPIIIAESKFVLHVIYFIIESCLALSVGFVLSSYFYTFFNNKNIEISFNFKKEKADLVMSPSKALFIKEFDMLFKDNSYIFSYTSLLILAPFLSFSVISSLNLIVYDNLRFFAIYFPELVNGMNLALILLFITVINSSAALGMSREGKTIQIVKYLPISPIKQIMIKLTVPVVLSLSSLLVSLIVLISCGIIEPIVFGMAILLGTIIILVNNILSIEWDMHDKGTNSNKLSGLSYWISIVVPILVLVIHLTMSYTYCPTYSLYLTEALLSLALLLLAVFNIKKRYIKSFKRMEVN